MALAAVSVSYLFEVGSYSLRLNTRRWEENYCTLEFVI